MAFFENFDLIFKGGPLMIALIVCSVLSFTTILERLIFLRRGRIIKIEILREIEIAIKKKDLEGALKWVQKATSPMLKIANVALINADKPKEDLKNYVEEAGILSQGRESTTSENLIEQEIAHFGKPGEKMMQSFQPELTEQFIKQYYKK